jgi:hypothetical protein
MFHRLQCKFNDRKKENQARGQQVAGGVGAAAQVAWQ